MNQRIIEVDYTNYRGERRVRQILPIQDGLKFSSTQWHPEDQWLLTAVDLETNTTKQFALSGFKHDDQAEILREANKSLVENNEELVLQIAGLQKLLAEVQLPVPEPSTV